MATKHFVIDECSHWQTVETVSEGLPQPHIVPSFACKNPNTIWSTTCKQIHNTHEHCCSKNSNMKVYSLWLLPNMIPQTRKHDMYVDSALKLKSYRIQLLLLKFHTPDKSRAIKRHLTKDNYYSKSNHLLHSSKNP